MGVAWPILESSGKRGFGIFWEAKMESLIKASLAMALLLTTLRQ
jgi:hypothetical protein